MNIYPYLAMARIGNWTKNLLMLAVALSLYVFGIVDGNPHFYSIALTFFSLCLASSANYVMNGACDVAHDQYHPIKKKRVYVTTKLNKKIVQAEYVALAICAMALTFLIHSNLFYLICLYLLCGWAYNMPPVRLKDKVYADVILESINYPIRILLGWLSVLPETYPPSSLLLLSWSAGAFAMSIKRLSEYRLFETKEEAIRYRKSYEKYNFNSLICISFMYGLLCIFGATTLILKYKIEWLLLLPFIAMILTSYLLMGLQKNLDVVYPERLVGNFQFIILVAVMLLAAVILSKISIPWLHVLTQPIAIHYVAP